MKILKNIFLIIIAIVLSYFVAFYFGKLYGSLFGLAEEGFFAIPEESAEFIKGVVLSYVFFISVSFTTFGDSKKYWWMGILLIPAVAIEVYFDIQHFYFVIALGLVAWLLGLGISKLRTKV